MSQQAKNLGMIIHRFCLLNGFLIVSMPDVSSLVVLVVSSIALPCLVGSWESRVIWRSPDLHKRALFTDVLRVELILVAE